MMRRLMNCFRPVNTTHNSVAETVSITTASDIEIDTNTNEDIDWKDTVKFVPPIISGMVLKVYDGDTITIASKLPYPESPIYRFSVRLNGIDCPEIKGKDENEKECAKLAKEEMTSLVLKKIVTLENVETEKYGRLLADVYVGDLHLNKHLIEKRLAVKYDGGTKCSPTNWMDYYCKGELGLL